MRPQSCSKTTKWKIDQNKISIKICSKLKHSGKSLQQESKFYNSLHALNLIAKRNIQRLHCKVKKITKISQPFKKYFYMAHELLHTTHTRNKQNFKDSFTLHSLLNSSQNSL